MNRLIKWHKDKLNDFAYRWDLSAYQVLWITFIKGLFIGYIIGEYL